MSLFSSNKHDKAKTKNDKKYCTTFLEMHVPPIDKKCKLIKNKDSDIPSTSTQLLKTLSESDSDLQDFRMGVYYTNMCATKITKQDCSVKKASTSSYSRYSKQVAEFVSPEDSWRSTNTGAVIIGAFQS